eukprot:3173043-Rhodomonas_salina.3
MPPLIGPTPIPLGPGHVLFFPRSTIDDVSTALLAADTQHVHDIACHARRKSTVSRTPRAASTRHFDACA